MPTEFSINDMRRLAAKKGGKCLSKKYLGARIPHKWQCEDGHIWKATPDNIKREQWCPIDAGKMSPRMAMKYYQVLARKRGGKLLSKRYLKSNKKLEWQCSEGHIWKATAGSVKNLGTWCPTCGTKTSREKRMLSVVHFQKIAEKRGGTLLSKEYNGVESKLRWQCKNGHVWEATPAHIKSGTWCPVCFGTPKLDIDIFRKTAIKKGGKLLSKKYLGIDSKLLWKCENDHIWSATPYNVRGGTWCPICSSYITERICRETLKVIFKKEFPKEKPLWLINNRGGQMELDGYNEGLKLSFEYQGKQHYKTTTHFKTTIENLAQRKKDDAQKRLLCHRKGLQLLIIPYTVRKENIYDFIINKLKKLGIRIPLHIKVPIHELNLHNRSRLQEMQDIAQSHEGMLLSKIYIDGRTPLKWQCKEGHIWETLPEIVRQGSWCRICNSKRLGIERELGIEFMEKLATAKGGECLSREYLNTRNKLRWQCKEGHIWETTPANILRGSWCPTCSRKSHKKKYNIEDMFNLAKKHGGKFLSPEYFGISKKHKWQCKEGHTWEAIPDSIKRGTWCPICARQK